MNTLERLDKLEAKFANVEKLAADLPAMQQTVNDLTKQVKSLFDGLTSLVNKSNAAFTNHEEFMQALVNKNLAVEQSLAAIGKTLNGAVQELVALKLIDGNNVMTRVRHYDEEQERERIKTLVQLKMLTPSEAIDKDSTVVVEQVHVAQDGMTKTLAEYRVVEMSNPLNGEDTQKKFAGKKVGNVIESALEGGTLRTKVIEVYASQTVTGSENTEAEENNG